MIVRRVTIKTQSRVVPALDAKSHERDRCENLDGLLSMVLCLNGGYDPLIPSMPVDIAAL